MTRLPVLASVCGLLLLAACGGGGASKADNATGMVPEGNEAVAADPRETAFCEAVEQVVAREDCDDLQAIAGQVRKGAAAFNVPDPMRRGQSVSVQLIVDRRSPETVAEIDRILITRSDGAAADPGAMNGAADSPDDSNVAAPAGNVVAPPGEPARPPMVRGSRDATPKQIADRLPGTTETFVPDVGRFMSADLFGQGFKIEARSPRSQEIPKDGQASWVWEVTALQGGERSLTLSTIVEGEVGGRRYPLADTKEVRKVIVEISIPDRIKDWLFGLPDWLKAITGVLTALAALAAAWFTLKSKFRREGAGKQD